MGRNDAVKFERNFMAPSRNFVGKNLRGALRNSAPKKQENKDLCGQAQNPPAKLKNLIVR